MIVIFSPALRGFSVDGVVELYNSTRTHFYLPASRIPRSPLPSNKNLVGVNRGDEGIFSQSFPRGPTPRGKAGGFIRYLTK